ncbi:MAG: MBL fold metallo-hydrolase [Eubacteriales bacterium]
MIVKVLAENTAYLKDYEAEHGLSLYIETGKLKILFDVGKSDVFLRNAKKLGVDISNVDLVVISHGHIDHGGGLKYFLKENTKALIYIHPKAFGSYYSKYLDGLKFIGLDEGLECNDRIIFTTERFFIDKGVEVFSNVPGKEQLSKCNKALMKEEEGKIVEDTFEHEQNMIVTEAGKMFVFAGCAHNGIVNILNHSIDLKKRAPDYVFGGFHLYSNSAKKSEDPDFVRRIGEMLKNTNIKYYTCHCTGVDPYNQLKDIMGDKIEYLATGRVIKI